MAGCWRGLRRIILWRSRLLWGLIILRRRLLRLLWRRRRVIGRSLRGSLLGLIVRLSRLRSLRGLLIIDRRLLLRRGLGRRIFRSGYGLIWGRRIRWLL